MQLIFRGFMNKFGVVIAVCGTPRFELRTLRVLAGGLTTDLRWRGAAMKKN